MHHRSIYPADTIAIGMSLIDSASVKVGQSTPNTPRSPAMYTQPPRGIATFSSPSPSIESNMAVSANVCAEPQASWKRSRYYTRETKLCVVNTYTSDPDVRLNKRFDKRRFHDVPTYTCRRT